MTIQNSKKILFKLTSMSSDVKKGPSMPMRIPEIVALKSGVFSIKKTVSGIYFAPLSEPFVTLGLEKDRHSNVVTAIDVTDTHIATGSRDGTVKIWSLDGVLQHTLRCCDADFGYGIKKVVLKENQIWACGDTHLKGWDLRTGQLRFDKTAEDTIGTFVIDARSLKYATQDTIVEVSPQEPNAEKVLIHSDSPIGTFVQHGSFLYISPLLSSCIEQWHLEETLFVKTQTFDHGWGPLSVGAMTCDASNTWLFVGSDQGCIKGFQIGTETVIDFDGHDADVTDMDCTAGILTTASFDETLHFYHLG
jgi:WD40 repeat protein